MPDAQVVVTVFAGNYNDFRHASGDRVFFRVMAARSAGNTLMYFVETTFNYPTMAEAYRVAALNGLNRVL